MARRATTLTWSNVIALVAAGASGIVGGCSKDGTDYGHLACLDSWPTLPSPTQTASLSVTPSILWQKSLGQIPWPSRPGVALSEDRIIASGGASWFALDRKSGAELITASTTPDPPNYFLGAPAVDEQGAIYAQSHVALYAFETDGRLRWTWAIPGQAATGEPSAGSFTPSVVGDRQILAYTATQLLAFSSEPKLLWTSKLGVMVSAGHWGVGYDGAATYVIDLRTGKPAGRLRAPNGHDVIPILPLAGRGILVMDRDNATALNLILLDSCGKEIWSLRVPGQKVCTGGAVVGPGEVVYLGIGSCSGGQPAPQIVGLGSDGRMASGPLLLTASPWIVGADGVLYAYQVDRNASTFPSKIVALSPALEALWQIDLPGLLQSGTNPALANDGILYMQVITGAGNEVIAVQTTSPGVASSSWPMSRHDVRSSNWAGGQF